MSLEYPCIYYRENGLCSYGGDLTDANICVFGPCDHETPSRADLVRRMSDEELAQNINRLLEGEISSPYCRELPECDDDLERDVLIPLERCEQCVLNWLRQPAEEVRGNET